MVDVLLDRKPARISKSKPPKPEKKVEAKVIEPVRSHRSKTSDKAKQTSVKRDERVSSSDSS